MSLKDFDLLGKIGEGAYSEVYKARRISDQKIYAIKKVIMKKLKAKEKNNAVNEIRILASINHPNVISYKQAFFDENLEHLFIVMEYADNGDLYQKILESRKKNLFISENFVWHILIKLSRGLHALHSLNIMHRDLKSANVFLTKAGKVKLGDMNVSKVAKENMNHTQTGTPYYASPEVWKDIPYDLKSDIWSLGCVVYETAALKPPFQADDMKSLFKKVTKGVFSPLGMYSDDLNFVIQKLLDLNPKNRPSASEILELPEVVKRVDVKTEKDNINSGLLNTIRLSTNIFDIKNQLPEAKYIENQELKSVEKIETKPKIHKNLAQVSKLYRGATYKLIEDVKKKNEITLAYYRNQSEKPRYYKKNQMSVILKESYGALKLPKAKYPNPSNKIILSPLSQNKLKLYDKPHFQD